MTQADGAGRERLAALDVGSHSIRLLVAEWDPQAGLTVIDELKEHPRLAAGLAATGRLDPAAMDAALAGLRRMHEVCQRRGARRLAAVATSAVREAENGPEFVHRVQAELGIPLRIIDGPTEAQLSYRSVAHHFRLQGERTLIVDIGGGSLEVIGAVDGVVELNLSLPLGAVRLTEASLPGERAAWKEVQDLRRAVRKKLRKAFDPSAWNAAAVIGSGGTFTNLGRMAIARRGLPIPDAVHGTAVVTGEVEALLEWLTTKSPAERAAVPGLSPYRADIILAGLAVTAELLELVSARKVTVSAFGIREGLLLEMAGAGDSAEPQDPLRLIREFADRCQTDRRHVEQVRVLALQLLDQLGPALGAEPEDRALLEAAALLHDVGQLVSYRRHHRHSQQLILNAERLNLSARDRAVVAIVSRYHRKRGPTRKHPEFAALPAEDQALVRRLAALLRVADGLDRGHTAIVERIQVELAEDRCTLRVAPRYVDADLSLEVWGADRKKDVLEKGLRREVVIVQGA
ncbi:MAG TPA: Ppx/GppA phosphatase family protein [Gemmatimonadales bacterium]|nr:Ppx/GppA phosphatase family protein [Gemmatimonadales bacterium]